MIPDGQQLELLGYDDYEIDTLGTLRTATSAMDDVAANKLTREALKRLWPEEITRFQKTSIILPKEGHPCWLQLKPAQDRFYREVIERCRRQQRPIRARICKARQMGFSTVIQALHYFWAYERANYNTATVSFDEPSTRELFQKAHYIDSMHFAPRAKAQGSATLISFASPHNSKFYVQTAGNRSALRSYRANAAHLSEIPMWPGRPEEVLTGLQQSIPYSATSSIIWESTAKGAYGPFYDGYMAAEEAEKELGEENMGFIPFFAPWMEEAAYAVSFPSSDHRRRFLRNLSHDDTAYMERYALTAEQMHFRAAKMKESNWSAEMFNQEYPAEARIAFLTSGAAVFDTEKVLALEANCTQPLWRGEVLLGA